MAEKPELIIGNKAYSSWSLRGWLALRLAGVEFDERVVPLDRPGTRAELADLSPSGLVPALRLPGGPIIWDSLAIGEWASETMTGSGGAPGGASGLWPGDPATRSVARSVACEMHAGFRALRRELPMDLKSDRGGQAPGAAAAADIARIFAVWRDCRERYGAGGDFLFGRAGLADIQYAPVVFRLTCHDVRLPPDIAAYADAMAALPAMVDWRRAAENEPWIIENP